jgi:uncharacterized RDD family membrane protein YckC
VAITVLKHHVPWGPFTRPQITHGLERGDFTLSSLAHTPGLKDWLPLGEVLDFYDRHASLPPLPAPRPPGDHLPPVPARHEPPPSFPSPPPPNPPAPFVPPVAAPAPRAPAVPAPIPEPAPLAVPTPAPKPAAVPSIPSAPSLPDFPPGLRPAPFFPRFFAFAIDIIVLFLPVIFLFALGALTVFIRDLAEHPDPETRGQEWALLFRHFEDLLFLVATGGAWLYGAGLECSRWQATVGKQWIGLNVTDAHGRRLSFFRATARHAAKYLSALPCFLGFTAAFFSPRGLALHDRIAATRVTRKPRH